MWKGRFQQPTAPLLQQFSESISFDWRLWRQDIEGSVAHSAALEAAGLITADERSQIVAGLREIGAEIEAGTFQFRTELEDIHMNIEAELTRPHRRCRAQSCTPRAAAMTRSPSICGFICARSATASQRRYASSSARWSNWRTRIATSSSPVTRISSARSPSSSRTIFSPTWKCANAIAGDWRMHGGA
jgi:hypothetical protein